MGTLRRIGLAFAILGLAVPTAWAQSGERYALLVGVRNYDRNELRNLNYAEDDVARMADVLRKSGYQRVVLMTQTRGADEQRFLPTADRIRTSLQAIVGRREPGDTVLVCFAGHGVQFQGGDEVWFCPMDAKLKDQSTLISLTDVYQLLEKCAAGTRLLLVDACRNDPRSDFSRARAEVDLESVTRPQKKTPPGGVAAFFSCSAGEKSYESPDLKHGVFFHFVIQGLSGAADLDRNGRVGLDELVSFTRKRVPDQVNEEFGDDVSQLPELVGKLRGDVTLISTAVRPSETTADTSKPFSPPIAPPKVSDDPKPSIPTTKPPPISPPVTTFRPNRPAEPDKSRLNEFVPFVHIAGIEPGTTTGRDVRKMFGDPEEITPYANGGVIWTWKSRGVSVMVDPKDEGVAVDYVYVVAPYAGEAKNGLKVGMAERDGRSLLLRDYTLGFAAGNSQFYGPKQQPKRDDLQIWFENGKIQRIKLFRP